MLRRTFLKLIGAIAMFPGLPATNNSKWDSLLCGEFRPWESPEYYIGQIVKNGATGHKMACVSINKGESYWQNMRNDIS